MAHEFESGFAVRTPSWHGLETLLDNPPQDWTEARELSGLTWEPELRPLYFVDEDGNLVEDEAARRVVRNDKPAREAGLGTVSGTFELITHEEMGTILEPVLEQPGCDLDTMGSIKGGRTVWALILLDEPYTIGGDVDGFGDPVWTLPYFGVMNSHDGTGACKGQYTQVRWVCANTVAAGAIEGDRHGAQFSLRHTSGVKTRIENARNVVDGCRVEAARWREMAEGLVNIKITDEQHLQFLSEFIPEPPAGVTSERVQENVRQERTKFLHILRDSATNAGIQHTGYGLFAASVEYLDHLRGFRNRDTYLGRQILRSEPLKAKAFDLVREVARV